jgi:hypothetical protein
MNTSSYPTVARRLRRRVIAVLMVAATFTSTAACGRPANLDLSLNRPTERNLFRVELSSAAHPVPLSKVHQWSVRVAGTDGKPITGAAIRVDGGMPEHGHGLPTAPRVEPTDAPGQYLIKGMKFSMTGWWVLKLHITGPEGRTDKITFNLVLPRP